MSALAMLGEFPQTKSDIAVFVQTAKEEILGGDYYALEVEVQLKKMEEIISGLRKDADFKKAVMKQLSDYTEKTIKGYHSCDITKKTNSSYDYDLCGDSELVFLLKQSEEASSKLKERQEFLKSIRQELVIVTPDGEIQTIYPPFKEEKESYSISIK